MIEVNHLTKVYGDHTAVEDLSFKIEKGQIYGFLGPNGAGKSTTMNIMTGCLSATQGQVKIGGYDIYKDAMKAKALIGYLPEIPPLYLDSTPDEYLKFVAEAKGVSKSDIPAQIEYVMDKTKIKHMRGRLIKHLSKGYKQRVGIAQALLGDPEVIILDEPTVGLDPMQIIEIRELIRELGKDHTVILSSHILSEVQAVCEVVLIISHGKLVACDTPENLEKQFAGFVSVMLEAECTAKRAQEILSNVRGITETDVLQDEDGRCRLKLASRYVVPDMFTSAIFKAFSKENCTILSMTPERASLETIFIELTQDAQENRDVSEDEIKKAEIKAAADSKTGSDAPEKTEESGVKA